MLAIDVTLNHCLTFFVQAFELPASHVEMSEQPVEDALLRFSTVLDRLEAASLRHQEGERLRMVLESELALMRNDRQMLAEKLDQETHRRRALEADILNLDQRIERAIAAVRDVLKDD